MNIMRYYEYVHRATVIICEIMYHSFDLALFSCLCTLSEWSDLACEKVADEHCGRSETESLV